MNFMELVSRFFLSSVKRPSFLDPVDLFESRYSDGYTVTILTHLIAQRGSQDAVRRYRDAKKKIAQQLPVLNGKSRGGGGLLTLAEIHEISFISCASYRRLSILLTSYVTAKGFLMTDSTGE